MAKDLTLSIIVPENKIKRSLPLALADIDSHFYSLRYKSYEIVIVGDSEGRGEDLIQGFGKVIPNLSFRSREVWNKGLRGENILIINSDAGIDFDHFQKIKESFGKKYKLAALSPETEKSNHVWLDKTTSLLSKILKFNFKPSHPHPYIIYAHRDLISTYPFLYPENALVKAWVRGEEVEVFKVSKKELNPISYVKIWSGMLWEKAKIIYKKLISKVKDKINRK